MSALLEILDLQQFCLLDMNKDYSSQLIPKWASEANPQVALSKHFLLLFSQICSPPGMKTIVIVGESAAKCMEKLRSTYSACRMNNILSTFPILLNPPSLLPSSAMQYSLLLLYVCALVTAQFQGSIIPPTMDACGVLSIPTVFTLMDLIR